MTHHAGYPPERDRPPTTGGLSIADRRTVNRLARDVLTIRRWVGFFGVLLVCVLIGGGSALLLLVGDIAGWWQIVMR